MLAKTNELYTFYSSLKMLIQSLNTIISPYNLFTISLVAILTILFFACKRKPPIYLLDFSCYCPPNSYRLPKAMFEENNFYDDMEPEAINFQRKITAKSGFSDQTSIPPSLAQMPKVKSLHFALEEAQTIMYSTITELFQKTETNPKSIDIVITNSSIFCPTPSLSSMIVNKFKMRTNIMSFHLSGMGCSAGIIAVGLAKDLLKVHRNSLALIVSTETLCLNWYTGKVPSMLLTNCLFRMGGSAILMSSKVEDKYKAKYKLENIVRTINAYDDESHGCVYQDVDDENKEGVSISKNIVNVCGDVLRKNIVSLGPLVLPLREQFLYVMSIICYKIWTRRRTSIYTPKFNKAFEHFCIHSGGRAVIQAIEKNLRLRDRDVEPSKMTLYRFGNTSSASIWYELSYIEAKGWMKCGDRVWQVGFGSGFKCNSAVWKCLCDVKPDIDTTAWRDTIDSYTVDILNTN